MEKTDLILALTMLLARLVLAVAFVGFFGFIVLKVLGMERDFLPGVRDVAMYLLGALTTSVVMVVGFFFNSSQSSAFKDFMVMRKSDGNPG